MPGFVTDAFALVLLVPAGRRGLARWLVAHAQSRFVSRAAGFAGGARRDYDVDATAYDVPPRPRGDRPQLNG